MPYMNMLSEFLRGGAGADTLTTPGVDPEKVKEQWSAVIPKSVQSGNVGDMYKDYMGFMGKNVFRMSPFGAAEEAFKTVRDTTNYLTAPRPDLNKPPAAQTAPAAPPKVMEFDASPEARMQARARFGTEGDPAQGTVSVTPGMSDADRSRAMMLFLRDKQYSNALAQAKTPGEMAAVLDMQKRNDLERQAGAPVSLNQSLADVMSAARDRRAARNEIATMDAMAMQQGKNQAMLEGVQMRNQADLFKTMLGREPTQKDVVSMMSDYARTLPEAMTPEQNLMNQLQINRFLQQVPGGMQVPVDQLALQNIINSDDFADLQEAYPDADPIDLMTSMFTQGKY